MGRHPNPTLVRGVRSADTITTSSSMALRRAYAALSPAEQLCRAAHPAKSGRSAGGRHRDLLDRQSGRVSPRVCPCKERRPGERKNRVRNPAGGRAECDGPGSRTCMLRLVICLANTSRRLPAGPSIWGDWLSVGVCEVRSEGRRAVCGRGAVQKCSPSGRGHALTPWRSFGAASAARAGAGAGAAPVRGATGPASQALTNPSHTTRSQHCCAPALACV
jgi:hypothetical protein